MEYNFFKNKKSKMLRKKNNRCGFFTKHISHAPLIWEVHFVSQKKKGFAPSKSFGSFLIICQMGFPGDSFRPALLPSPGVGPNGSRRHVGDAPQKMAFYTSRETSRHLLRDCYAPRGSLQHACVSPLPEMPGVRPAYGKMTNIPVYD